MKIKKTNFIRNQLYLKNSPERASSPNNGHCPLKKNPASFGAGF
jgi:hypothetical protein